MSDSPSSGPPAWSPTAPTASSLGHRLMIVFIILIAAAARLPGLTHTPPPLNQDEASRGYDAWCLLETGADRHGQRWPLFLESFGPGDFTAALTTFITIPFVRILGPTVTAMRLPDALFGVATIYVFYVWLRNRFNWATASIAALCLATDPWHISITRSAHEAGFAPFFMAMAIWALDGSGIIPGSQPGGRGRGWAILAGLMLGLHTWVYPAPRLFTPLFCIALCLIFRNHLIQLARRQDGRLTLAALVVGLIVGTSPLWLTAITHPERLAARASVTLLDFRLPELPRSLSELSLNFLKNVDPRHLFLDADDMSGATLPGTGLHLLVTAPLILAGLIRSVFGAWRRDRWHVLLLAWIVLGVVPAAVCGDWNPHPLRTISNVIPVAALAGLGADWLFRAGGPG